MNLLDRALVSFHIGAMGLQLFRREDYFYCPLILCGDFNFDFKLDPATGTVLNYLHGTHRLTYVSKNLGISTRNGTTIDVVFSKMTPLELMYYTLYFSTHRAILISVMKRKQESRDRKIQKKQSKFLEPPPVSDVHLQHSKKTLEEDKTKKLFVNKFIKNTTLEEDEDDEEEEEESDEDTKNPNAKIPKYHFE